MKQIKFYSAVSYFYMNGQTPWF